MSLHTHHEPRYPNGRSKRLQSEADKRYRSSQREQRAWVRDLATHLGVPPEELVSTSAAEVAALLRSDSATN